MPNDVAKKSAPLDGPPPPAQGAVRRAPEPPMASSLGINPVSAAATTEDLLMRAMELETRVREYAITVPELAPVAAQFVDALRMAITARIQGGGMMQQGMQQPMMQQQPMAQANPMMGAAPQPAGLGAGPQPMM